MNLNDHKSDSIPLIWVILFTLATSMSLFFKISEFLIVYPKRYKFLKYKLLICFPQVASFNPILILAQLKIRLKALSQNILYINMGVNNIIISPYLFVMTQNPYIIYLVYHSFLCVILMRAKHYLILSALNLNKLYIK